MIKFDKRLKILRKKRSMNQAEFAKLLEIPQSSLSAYETGKHLPSADRLWVIADKCNVSTDWLWGTGEVMTPSWRKLN